MIRRLAFSAAKKMGLSPLFLSFTVVSVGNISLNFQTFINCNNPVRLLRSTQRSGVRSSYVAHYIRDQMTDPR